MKKILHHKDFKIYFTLAVILFIGVILRFYNTPYQYTFDSDAVRDAIIAHEGAKNFYVPLSGPFSSTGPFTFGPWYFYSIIITAFFFPNPYSPWVLMGIVSLCSIVIMYQIGVLLESKKLGLLLAFITAIAPTQISAGTALSNISPVPFFTILSVWLMLLTLKKKTSKLVLVLLGMSLGLGINAHFQSAGLLLLPLLVWFYKGWKVVKIPLFIGLGLGITFIPLFLFNLNSEWYTVRGLQHTISLRDHVYVANSWKIYLLQFWPSYLAYISNLPQQIIVAIVLGIGAMLSFNVFKKRVHPGIIILLIIFGTNFLNLRYYWGVRNFVYLFYLESIVLIFICYGLFQILKFKYGKYIFIALFAAISFGMISKDYMLLHTKPLSHKYMLSEVAALQQSYPNKNVIIYSCDLVHDDVSKSMAYFESFTDKKQWQEDQKIGVVGHNRCEYPKTRAFNYEEASISAKFAASVYPRIPKSISLVNFSIASESAIKNATWSAVITKTVYNSNIKWWQNRALLNFK